MGAKFWRRTIEGEMMGEAEMEVLEADRAEGARGKEREGRKKWAVERNRDRAVCSAAFRDIF